MLYTKKKVDPIWISKRIAVLLSNSECIKRSKNWPTRKQTNKPTPLVLVKGREISKTIHFLNNWNLREKAFTGCVIKTSYISDFYVIHSFSVNFSKTFRKNEDWSHMERAECIHNYFHVRSAFGLLGFFLANKSFVLLFFLSVYHLTEKNHKSVKLLLCDQLQNCGVIQNSFWQFVSCCTSDIMQT